MVANGTFLCVAVMEKPTETGVFSGVKIAKKDIPSELPIEVLVKTTQTNKVSLQDNLDTHLRVCWSLCAISYKNVCVSAKNST